MIYSIHKYSTFYLYSYLFLHYYKCYTPSHLLKPMVQVQSKESPRIGFEIYLGEVKSKTIISA